MQRSTAPARVPAHLVVLASVDLDRALASLATRQFGCVTFAQLSELGLSPGAVDHRLKIGQLHRRHTGVYTVGHEHLDLRGQAKAALLWAGEEAVLSHATAAVLWKLLARDHEGPCHVTTTVRSAA